MDISGEYEVTLDDKGRISLPKRLEYLFERGGFLTRSTTGRSLHFYPPARWARVQEMLAKFPAFSRKGNAIRLFLNCGQDVRPYETASRFTMPPALRKYANIEKSVTLVALGNDEVAIWDTETWRAHYEENLTPEYIGALMEEMEAEVTPGRSALPRLDDGPDW